jgi:hypothetical protein
MFVMSVAVENHLLVKQHYPDIKDVMTHSGNVSAL